MTAPCVTVLWTDDGRAVVPGNRWDLVGDARPAELPRVSVVVPSFDAPEALSRLLAALELQTYPHHLLDIVIADDGSPEPITVKPTIGDSIPVTVVRQEDLGFRAAAARNLGVAASVGEVLCFLDQDMVPEPRYVERLTRLCGVLPDALVVGRRRHADLRGWSDDAVVGWLSGAGPAPEPVGDPEWLTEAYERTGNLLEPDFRYVISAVMACSRQLYEELAGFDETFTEYGGEDWEFAYRAWNAGAVLAHEPEAVAWHDGPDWAGRGTAEERDREKAAERKNLAERIPVMRPGPWPGAEIVDVCVLTDDLGLALRLSGTGLDLGVYDSLPPGRVLAAARWVARVHDATAFVPEMLAAAMEPGAGRVDVGAVLTVTSTRAGRRAERWQPSFPGVDLVRTLFGSHVVQVREVA